MKVLRACPRCKGRFYHYYQDADKTASCANCGHTWKVRLKTDEKDCRSDIAYRAILAAIKGE